jgi:hypothetical protein
MSENQDEFKVKMAENYSFHCEICDLHFEQGNRYQLHSCEDVALAMRGIRKKSRERLPLATCCLETVAISLIYWSFINHFDYSLTHGLVSILGLGLFLGSYYGRKMVRNDFED